MHTSKGQEKVSKHTKAKDNVDLALKNYYLKKHQTTTFSTFM